MKVIDLLNKIANNELPKDVKLYDKDLGIDLGICDLSDLYTFLCDGDIDLNDEMEIVEGTKKYKTIEKIYYWDGENVLYDFVNEKNKNIIYLRDKINEIIDVVNKLKERE